MIRIQKSRCKAVCQQTTNLTKLYEWGMSAGSGISKAYTVDVINDSPDTIVSPHALAGFIPVFPNPAQKEVIIYGIEKSGKQR